MKNSSWFKIFSTLFFLSIFFMVGGCYHLRTSGGGGQTEFEDSRQLDANDIMVPAGYSVELIAQGLTFPTGIAFDEQGLAYVVEAGYSYGEEWTTPKLLRLDPNGRMDVIAQGSNNGPWNGIEYYSGAFYISEGGQLFGGRILRITGEGDIKVLVHDLPSMGDHHTNGPVISPDGWIYFGQGTATNSGVVGKDNWDFGWLKRHRKFHDIPCRDIVLKGRNYKSENLLGYDQNCVCTGAFKPYGEMSEANEVIKGSLPCSGSIMRVRPSGEDMQMVAWGLRNPFGLAFSDKDELFITENGYDVRGARPVFGTGDHVWKIQQETWYGWPDYSGGVPLTSKVFKGGGVKPPGFVLARHPQKPPTPAAVLGVHAAACGLDFSRTEEFGFKGEAFVALFGDMAPKVGKVLSPVGYKVVRVNIDTGIVKDFAINKGRKIAPASFLKTGGLERPIDVQFGPDGKSLYIVDFGVMTIGDKGPEPRKCTGVVWRITKDKK